VALALALALALAPERPVLGSGVLGPDGAWIGLVGIALVGGGPDSGGAEPRAEPVDVMVVP
jgi:hypothetical protein